MELQKFKGKYELLDQKMEKRKKWMVLLEKSFALRVERNRLGLKIASLLLE